MATAGPPSNVYEVRDTLKMMQKNLECPICLEMLKDPYSTHCGHPFCKVCICTAITQSKAPKCPLCKKPISKRSLSENTRLSDIIDAVELLEQAIIKDTGITSTPPHPLLHSRDGTGTPGMQLHSLLHPTPVKPHPPSKGPLLADEGRVDMEGTSPNGSSITRPQRKRKLVMRATDSTGAGSSLNSTSSSSPSPLTRRRKSRFLPTSTQNGQCSIGRSEGRETLSVEDPADSALLEALREAPLQLPDTQLTDTSQHPSRFRATTRRVKNAERGGEGRVEDVTDVCLVQDTSLIRNDAKGDAESMVVSLPIACYQKTVDKRAGGTPVIREVDEINTRDVVGDGVADILTAAEDVVECEEEVGMESGGDRGEKPSLSLQSDMYLSPCISQQNRPQRNTQQLQSQTSVVCSSQLSQDTVHPARDHSLPGLTTRDHFLPGSTTRDHSLPGLTTRDHSPPGPTTRDHSPPDLTTRDRSPPGLTTRNHSLPGLTTRDHSPLGLTTRDHTLLQETSPPASVSVVPDSLCLQNDRGDHPVISQPISTHSDSPAHNSSSVTSSSQGLTLSTQDLEVLQLRVEEKQHKTEELLVTERGRGRGRGGGERERERGRGRDCAGDLQNEVFIIPESISGHTHLPPDTAIVTRREEGVDEEVIDLTDDDQSTLLAHTAGDPPTHHQESHNDGVAPHCSNFLSLNQSSPCRPGPGTYRHSHTSPKLLQMADRLFKTPHTPPVVVTHKQTRSNVDRDSISSTTAAESPPFKHNSAAHTSRGCPPSLPHRECDNRITHSQQKSCSSADSHSSTTFRHTTSSHKTKLNFRRRNVKWKETPPTVQLPRLPDNHPFLSVSTTPSLHPYKAAMKDAVHNKFQSSKPLEVQKCDISTHDVEKQQKSLTTDCAANSPPSFLASSLSRVELLEVKQLAKSHGGRLASVINGRTSHLIVPTDENNCSPRTLKYLQALASGIWIVSYKWVTDSIVAGRLLPECGYEVSGDHTICSEAPRTARTHLSKQGKCAGLFNSYRFILHSVDSQLVSNTCLAQLIVMAGGQVIGRDTVTELRDGVTDANTVCVVDNDELTDEGCGLYPTVTSGWILDCISEYRILDIRASQL